jgi:hypothetical protein
MALTKRELVGKVEVLGEWKHLQMRMDTVIEEDGKEISRKYFRRAYTPDDDLESLDAPEEVKKIAEVFWTEEHIQNYKDAMKIQEERIANGQNITE